MRKPTKIDIPFVFTNDPGKRADKQPWDSGVGDGCAIEWEPIFSIVPDESEDQSLQRSVDEKDY